MRFNVDAWILQLLPRIFNFKDGNHCIAFNAHFGDPGHVVASAFDGIKYMRASFDAIVADEGEGIFCVGYLSIVPLLEGLVTVNLLKKEFTFKDDKPPFTIPLMVPDGPYLMPELKPRGSVTIELGELQTLIKRVRFATGSDESTAYDCVLLSFGDYIQAVGCDRRTLAVAKVSQKSPYKGKFLLPKEGLEVLSKLDGDIATLSLYRNGIGISVDGEVMVDMYIPERTGSFPQYEEILQVGSVTSMACAQGDLQDVLTVMRHISDEVSITFGYNTYAKSAPRLRSRDQNNAAVERFLKSPWQGREMKVKINARILMQAIENISGSIAFNFSDEQGAFALTSEDRNFTAVLLPYSRAERK